MSEATVNKVGETCLVCSQWHMGGTHRTPQGEWCDGPDFLWLLKRRVEAFERRAPKWLIDAVNAELGPLIWGDER